MVRFDDLTGQHAVMMESATSTPRVYVDNAATSFPKPPKVLQAMVHYAQAVGASAGRGAYAEARESGRVIGACRERLNTLFHGEDADHFIFTLNCSDSLNMAIHGLLQPGDHAISTAMDHNSVLRPFNELATDGRITRSVVPVDAATGLVDPQDIRRALTAKTRLIVIAHASNVSGSLQDIREIGRIAREAGAAFLVDAAQSAGHVPIDVRANGIDFLAVPGHKGLLGPLGTGVLYIRPGMEKRLRTVRQGGTGSVSESDFQPEFMPDRFEPGSHNAIGIAGLSEGVAWVLDQTVEKLRAHEESLCAAFMEAAAGIEGLTFLGPRQIAHRVGVFSVRVEGWEPLALADELENEFNILTRSGLHCAPLAHRTFGTHLPAVARKPESVGTTRLSFGPFLTRTEVNRCVAALETIAARSGKLAQAV